MKNKELKEVMIFFIITVFLSLFVFWGPLALCEVPTIGFNSGAVGPVWAIILFMMGGFVPSITGIILTAVFEGKKQVKQFMKEAFQAKIGLKWVLIIILTAAYFAVSWIVIYLALDGNFHYAKFLSVLPTILPLFILGPLSEEYGWRGFALKRLLKIVNPNIASLIIGLVWSVWHLPLFYIVGTNQHEQQLLFFTFMISVTSSCFIYTYIYIKTNQNLFTAVLFHWAYTFFSDAAHSSIIRSDLFNVLEFFPALLIGVVFSFLLHRIKPILKTTNASNAT
ncbi:CPBP family intramembrane glutamic endopeptidase [Paenibacillus sp. UMB4589-SE434]|uniref:CPBP family intramembrane glutamic endopeptidase n=1 Tax=Paenibacillus sp. UMB4589-SE434 TaxID=3046314 RepID=UPI002550F876|nr:CPBP family intramembrane glutamic endopeptidase [Paenibacillus sp. UMB4589-SE434]MDK8180038.1 CPBP family intramembrane metalloprotease [Paenibacillus sp. UMB4589-SE434]